MAKPDKKTVLSVLNIGARLLVICLVTTPLVFLVTGWTVQAVMKWTARKEDKPDV